jgi:hypothetical protein
LLSARAPAIPSMRTAVNRPKPSDSRPPSRIHPRITVRAESLIISHLVSVISNPRRLETTPHLSRRNVRKPYCVTIMQYLCQKTLTNPWAPIDNRIAIANQAIPPFWRLPSQTRSSTLLFLYAATKQKFWLSVNQIVSPVSTLKQRTKVQFPARWQRAATGLGAGSAGLCGV